MSSQIVIRDSTLPPASLEAWKGYINEVFEQANSGVAYSGFLERMQAKVNRLVSPKYANREQIARLREFCSWFWGWTCGLLKSLEINDISNQIFLEFPNCCNRCFERPCTEACCKIKKDRERAQSEGAYLQRKRGSMENFTLQSLADFVRGIYPSNFERSISDAAGKLAEELGELRSAAREWAAAGRKRNPRDLAKVYEELVDVMFWYVTVFALVEAEARYPDFSKKPQDLDTVCFRFFENGCPECSPRTKQRRCICNRGAEYADRDLIDLVQERERSQVSDPDLASNSETGEITDAEFRVKK